MYCLLYFLICSWISHSKLKEEKGKVASNQGYALLVMSIALDLVKRLSLLACVRWMYTALCQQEMLLIVSLYDQTKIFTPLMEKIPSLKCNAYFEVIKNEACEYFSRFFPSPKSFLPPAHFWHGNVLFPVANTEGWDKQKILSWSPFIFPWKCYLHGFL